MTLYVYKGWNAKIYKEGVLIGYCDSASVDIATGLDPYYEIGSRTPSYLTEGNQEITGSISKAWIDINYLNLVIGTGSLTEFDLTFKAYTSGAPWIYLYDCKFESGSLDIPQDGVLTESYDFRAKTVGVKMG